MNNLSKMILIYQISLTHLVYLINHRRKMPLDTVLFHFQAIQHQATALFPGNNLYDHNHFLKHHHGVADGYLGRL